MLQKSKTLITRTNLGKSMLTSILVKKHHKSNSVMKYSLLQSHHFKGTLTRQDTNDDKWKWTFKMVNVNSFIMLGVKSRMLPSKMILLYHTVMIYLAVHKIILIFSTYQNTSRPNPSVGLTQGNPDLCFDSIETYLLCKLASSISFKLHGCFKRWISIHQGEISFIQLEYLPLLSWVAIQF